MIHMIENMRRDQSERRCPWEGRNEGNKVFSKAKFFLKLLPKVKGSLPLQGKEKMIHMKERK